MLWLDMGCGVWISNAHLVPRLHLLGSHTLVCLSPSLTPLPLSLTPSSLSLTLSSPVPHSLLPCPSLTPPLSLTHSSLVPHSLLLCCCPSHPPSLSLTHSSLVPHSLLFCPSLPPPLSLTPSPLSLPPSPTLSLTPQERQKTLENMGISVQASGIGVQPDKFYLVNLNADPTMNELLVCYLKVGAVVSTKATPPDPHPPNILMCRTLQGLAVPMQNRPRTFSFKDWGLQMSIASSNL